MCRELHNALVAFKSAESSQHELSKAPNICPSSEIWQKSTRPFSKYPMFGGKSTAFFLYRGDTPQNAPKSGHPPLILQLCIYLRLSAQNLFLNVSALKNSHKNVRKGSFPFIPISFHALA